MCVSRSTSARRHRPVGLAARTGVSWYGRAGRYRTRMWISRTTGVRLVVWAAGLLLPGRVRGRRRFLLLRVGLMCRCRFLLLLRRVRLVHGRCRFFLRFLLLYLRLMDGRRGRWLRRGVLHGRWCLYRWRRLYGRFLYGRLNGLLRVREQAATATAAKWTAAKSSAAGSVAGWGRIRCLGVG